MESSETLDGAWSHIIAHPLVAAEVPTQHQATVLLVGLGTCLRTVTLVSKSRQKLAYRRTRTLHAVPSERNVTHARFYHRRSSQHGLYSQSGRQR